MADAKLVAVLKKGAEAWNNLTHQSGFMQEGGIRSFPDLRGADLQGANLRHADLFMVNLSGANLSGADLSLACLDSATLHEANLSGAQLRGVDLGRAGLGHANIVEADLSFANLSRADLSGSNLSDSKLREANGGQVDLRGSICVSSDFSCANLREARLDNADLRHAILVGVNLSQAVLKGADISSANLNSTVFADVDLHLTKGLDLCNHYGPSFIDLNTSARSGSLPLAFLRGCGLPDGYIEYLPSLVRNPIQFDSCFISYSSKDEDFAVRLHADLQNKGVRCWFAKQDIQGGMKIHEQIDSAIQIHERLLLILSDNSMQSEWVKTEVAKARKREVSEKRRILFPVRLNTFEAVRQWECFDADTGKDLGREIREYYVPDFSKWKNHDCYQQELQKLLRDLKNTEPPPAFSSP